MEAFGRLKFAFPRHTSVIALMALEGALTDRDWRRIDPDRLAQIRREAGV